MMTGTELQDFAQWEIYECTENGTNRLAICKSQMVAEIIASLLASRDPKFGEYHISLIAGPNDFIPGGGVSITYQIQRREVS